MQEPQEEVAHQVILDERYIDVKLRRFHGDRSQLDIHCHFKHESVRCDLSRDKIDIEIVTQVARYNC